MACSRLLQRYWSRSRTYHRPHVSISAGFPSSIRFLGNPSTVPYPVDTCSVGSTTQGYSVPDLRLLLKVGPHSSPGFLGVSLGRLQSRPALILALLAQAYNPRRLVPPNDDSNVDSCTCPCSATLDGIPGRIPSDRLLSPLGGLMVSRYRRGYALTSTPEGQEFHLHGDQVIKDQTDLSSLSPTTFVRLWFQGNGSHLQPVVRRQVVHT
jgi:hypothetical protein